MTIRNFVRRALCVFVMVCGVVADTFSIGFNLTIKDINKIRAKKEWGEVDAMLNKKGWIAERPENLGDRLCTQITWKLFGGYRLTIERGWKEKADCIISMPKNEVDAFASEIGKAYERKAQTKTKTFRKKGLELMLSQTKKGEKDGIVLFSTKDKEYWTMLTNTGKDPDVRHLDTYQIGDYIEEEGGILFYVSDDYTYGYILAMTDAGKGKGCEWGAEGIDLEGKYPYTTKEWHEANFDYDGERNTEAVMKYLERTPERTPKAADLAKGYDGGGKRDWYLPAEGQLRMIKDNFERLNNRLRANGGVSLAKAWYWSSTEYDATFTWGVNFKSMIVGRSTKRGMDHVRAVRTVRMDED